ncbi:two-component system OmpR family sensor kinase [Saccharopolyspora erythraea NRRL 2338]|uniref:histidine kinase n=1 Tax=Saccharopolyspora erythraea TaxID=1836 RepID=A0ABP3LSQ3_SACER|nr:HAMP domain-containing sensor histidine kinase [Saccharopolyspora erythraea]EQD85540.1 histidine kinase [Saccharopolyspora erythraea D]PFG98915.1 two-component system OmpR family sensor kinase [Saccharopolyspora erythraea NRRL 2338]
MRPPVLPRTLRGRLLAVLLVAAAAGLVVMGSSSVALLERSLINRTDDRLAELSRPWVEGREPPPEPSWPPDHGPPRGRGELPTDFRVLFFDSTGRPTGDMLGRAEGDTGGPLLLNPAEGPAIGTVPDRAGGADWRVRTLHLPDGRTIALALSLGGVDATVGQLVFIELVAGAVVLLALVATAAVTVRLGLRPLTRIEHTADAIAAGELDRRVPDQDVRTETGRLGAALNTMLGRLAAAMRERERSEERMRRFVADASHELRTPLTSIRGFAELYRRSDTHREEDVRRIMSRIEGEAVRMGAMVEDLLLLARLDRERSMDLTDCDLLPLAADVVHDAAARDPDREIALRAPDAPVRVLADAARLRQVLTNLVGNALVHTPAGTPVQVVVDHGTAGEDVLAATGADVPSGALMGVVEVSDRGPGIAPEHAQRIFDRFYRVDDGRNRSGGGTGLGLAITAALAEAHGGRVELARNSAGGCTFRVLVPLA